MNRCVIYFHYHPNGQADSACLFAVRALLAAGAKVLFVTNGKLDAASRAAVEQLGVRLLERENTGLDVGAYRDALFALGRDGLSDVDELILMNYTLAGPVSPLADFFARMDARPDLDFWGLTRHYAMKSRRFGGRKGTVPEHIQSHFLALRPRLFLSDAFWDYWQKMSLPHSYEDSIRNHETRFTAHFAALGYVWDTAVDTSDLAEIFVNPIMGCPAELTARRGCPFFKRRSFFTPYADELRRTDGAAALELYRWLKRHTDYPVDDLIRSLLRTQPLADLARNLHWSATLPEEPFSGEAAGPVRLVRWQPGIRPELRAGEILCLYREAPEPPRDAADWYARRTVRMLAEEEQLRSAAAALLAARPLMGLAMPALPACGAAYARRIDRWRQTLPALRAEADRLGWKIPVAAEVPLPEADCVLIRAEAFPEGLPPLDTPAGWLLLPLAAQVHGYGTLQLLSAAASAALPERLSCALYDAQDAAESGKNMARALRRRLRGR